MGCNESRPASSDQVCYYTLGACFQGGAKDEMQLRPHDMVEQSFRNSECLTKQGIEIEDRNLVLNEKLEFDDHNSKMTEYVKAVQDLAIIALNILQEEIKRNQRIQKKLNYVGEKYEVI